MSEKFLLLDSRDQQVSGSATEDCFFYLQYGGLFGVSSVELLNFSLPLTMYNINSRNNVIYFNDGSARSFAIPPGNYTMTNLLVMIKAVMEAVSTITFTVTFSDITMKITIAGDSPFSLDFGTNTTNSIAKVLGFLEIDTPAGASLTGVYVMNLSIPLYINICIDGFSSSIKSSNKNDNATFSCSTIGNNSDILTWTAGTFYQQKVYCTDDNIQNLHVTIRDYNNQMIQLNGCNWSMLLKINY